MRQFLKRILAKSGKQKILLLAVLVVIALGGTWHVLRNNQSKPPTITSAPVEGVITDVNITSSLGRAVPIDNLQANPGERIELESKEIAVKQPLTNALSLEWLQEGEEGLDLLVRTKRNGSWTPWVSGLQDEDRKDGDNSTRASTLVLAQAIEEFQYRFTVTGNAEGASAKINLGDAKLTAINSNDGPRSLKSNQSLLSKAALFLGFSKKANALAEGPRIISRAEWGSPEPNSSPRWTPEYYSLGRAIVHHTVSTENPNALAAVRAIWDYHANGRGWGDIGYNYLVDSAGNIFQGRYFNQDYSLRNKVEVEAGHTLGHNKGTIGIAAIGNFQTQQVPQPTLASISELIAYRFAPYDLNPFGNGPFDGPTVIGHRDHGSTACPGTNLYNQLPNIRVWAAQRALHHANMHKLDYRFVSQVLYVNGAPATATQVFSADDDVELAINLKNYGLETWKNTGVGAVRLGTVRPFDRASPFYDSSWPHKNRTPSFTGKLVDGAVEPTDSVAFEETAQFRFKLKIPELASSSGTTTKIFNEYFTPVIDGRSWFLRDIGLYQPVKVVAKSYVWQHQNQRLYTNSAMSTPVNPQNLVPGQRYYAVVRARNVGTAPWRQDTMRLGTSNPQNRSSQFYDSTWVSQNRPARLKESNVAPNAIGTFEFWITAPSGALSRKEYFRPVADGVAWLNDLGLYFDFRVQ